MKPDAIKGIRHFEGEVLEGEVEVSSGKDARKLFNSIASPLVIQAFNSSHDDYIVRVYRVEKSVRLPKRKS